MNTDYTLKELAEEAGVKRILGYIRVSTDRQEHSPDTQERLIRAVTPSGVPLLLFRDQESAFRKTLAQRENGAQMLRDVRPGDVIVVCDIDRLGRNALDLMGNIAWLHQHGARVFDAVSRKTFELESPDGFLINGLRCLLAQYESMYKGARLRRVAANSKRQGKPYHGRPRYGYIRVRWYDGQGQPRIRWDWNQAEWDQMELIAKLYDKGGMDFGEIAAWFNQRGDLCWDSGKNGCHGRGEWNICRVQRRYHWYKRQLSEGGLDKVRPKGE